MQKMSIIIQRAYAQHSVLIKQLPAQPQYEASGHNVFQEIYYHSCQRTSKTYAELTKYIEMIFQ